MVYPPRHHTNKSKLLLLTFLCHISLHTECTNQFVEVEYDRIASTITCRFLDETDTSVKLCTVMYGECGQELVQTTQGSSTMETPNNIVLSVDANKNLECYSVTASSDLVTVIVESVVNSEERGI